MSALPDTGFLLAVLNTNDARHRICTDALEDETNPLLPDVVVPELAYMIVRELGYGVLAAFLRAVASGELTLIRTEATDLSRAAEMVERRQP